MLLHRIAGVSEAVAATSSRSAKRDLLAEVIAALGPNEVEAAIGFLTGSPRQGSIGVGWATIADVDVEPVADTAATVTVSEVDELLDQIAVTTGPGSAQARRELLAGLLSRMTRTEQGFVRRLLTGGLRQGALAGVVSDAVAAAAGVKAALVRRATMLQGDLGRTALVALTEGTAGLDAVDLEVGRPILPMLASTAESVTDAVGALGLVQVEWKLDGARIQVHRRGDDVGIYTRNLNDVTDRLPQVVNLVQAFDCQEAVLDGEVIGFLERADDGADDDPNAFQDTMSAFGTDAAAGAAHGLRPFFFDLMFVDGQSLIDVPLGERSERLGALVGQARIPTIVTGDGNDAEAHLQAALDAGHEGVMVKGVDGAYEAGRRGKSWRKVKPVHTLDLVVLAAEWGHGRRRGWLSNLHLGARDPSSGELVMVGKTFKGLTDELLTWQTEAFLARRIDERDGGHTVVIAPELVVEIALDGAQRSTRYPGGVALRFARVRGYRPDKSPAEADTLDAVRALL